MIKDWSWKAILGGLAIDIGGSLIIGTLVGILVGILMVSGMVSGGNLGDPSGVFNSSTPALLFLLIAGLSMDCLGGYLAATWAPKRKIAHALVLGILSVASGLVLSGASFPLWYRIASSLLIVPAALLGGWWRVKTRGAESEVKRKDSSSSGSPPIASPF